MPRGQPPRLSPMFPRVTAVLVVQHGGDRLRTTLDALRSQTRPPDDLAVVLMDADDATRRLVEAQRPSHVVSLGASQPFGAAIAAVEQTLPEPGDERSSLWLLTEDAAPEPAALESLVASLENARTAAIAAPKLVDWDDPRRIVRFGRSVTRGGRSMAIVEGELDQGQHDDLSDVLGADPVGMLVRHAVWRDLGGLDPALPVVDDGLDLGTRARLAGHRVVAVPGAVLRFGDAGVAGPGSEPGGRAARHRARIARTAWLHRRLVSAPAVLVPLHWLAILPIAVLRSLRHLLVKTPGSIPGEFAAAVEVMVTPQRVVRSRRAIARVRTAKWSALAPLRIRPDEVRARRQQAAEARRQRARGRADDLQFLQTGGGWVLLATLALSIVLFAPLLASGGISGGGLLPLSNEVSALWRNAAAGWRDIGGGFVGAADPFAGVLAVLGSAAFWNPSAALLGLWLAAIPLSGLGGWFAASRLTERASLRVLGGLAWAVAPPLLDALAAGRPAAVLVHVLLPWLAVLMFAAGTSWAAAAAASLVFAAIVACAPVLAPALVLAWLVALPLSGRAAVRLVGIPLPALALALPLIVQQVGRGAPLSLLADPGLPHGAGEPTVAQVALGQANGTWGRWEDALGGLVAEVVPPPILLAVLLAPLALAALAVVASRRLRGGLLALALAAAGFATAVGATLLHVAFSGERTVPVWTGAGISVMWLGLLAAAILALSTLRRGAAAAATLVAVFGIVAVAPTVVAIALGRTAVGPAPERTLPAFVEAEAGSDPRVGTLRMQPTADGGIRATIERGTGATLDEQSTLASTRRDLTGTTESIATLAGNLASRSGYDATAAVEEFGLSFVLLGDADPADPAATAVHERARAALDGNPQVVATGETDFGPIWRFVDAEPDAPGARIPDPGPVAGWVVAGQLMVVGAALLLSIPTGGGREPDRRPPSVRRRRRRPAVVAAESGETGTDAAAPDDTAAGGVPVESPAVDGPADPREASSEQRATVDAGAPERRGDEGGGRRADEA
ncbi:glycosyltransferase [Agromyces bracchium]|uniref:Glycosyltransferase n=2 Tax=Agromyces bracchium TaxID=88376 RepID=A0A6I3MF06_9MICO|nr:glycosyltransferase [Agromyces bracchium]